eukprot:CAMPEP_0201666728 /NCGR_PEP_ID=MMETSP0494-20130426/9515_1 /ASSEMBLY_ACC=CAM_ASM_000839 /TAXON_ID=420259 /ORGANISM="Thalassiosira gravida, Strain GMp14c1" /LENGTH=449 /DNA_ID=CAMNT_0048146185 /DNA_START=228 /DNA_END=1577 /DNA_ORIENTATION=+
MTRRPSARIHFHKTPPLVGNDADANNLPADKNLHSSIYRFAKSSSDEESESSWTDGGRISVTVEKDIPFVFDADTAKEAWLKHHWRGGGGLPIYVSQKDNNEALRRVIMPIMMEEQALVKKDEDSPSTLIEYTVTKPGWAFQSDLVDNSHSSSVSFVPLENSSGCKMIWNVEFDTIRFRGLYQAVTEFTIGTASRTVVESLSTPRLLTVQSTFNSTSLSSPIEARKEWLEFVWARGGGLPLPPGFLRGEVLEEGGGSAKRSIVRVPPLIVETILSTDSTEDSTELMYEVENPGWLTFPFLLHTHLARVRFSRASNDGGGDWEGGDGSVDIKWEMEVRPFPIFAPLVEKLLEMAITTIVRNLVVHFADPGATVEIRPARGNENLAGGIDSFGSVPNDTWLGGVLDAHLRDDRSTVEQTLSLVQPWLWGRTGNGDEDDDVMFGWSNRGMPL